LVLRFIGLLSLSLLLFALGGDSSFAKSSNQKIKSNIHIIFDFSNSYFTKEKENNNKNRAVLRKTFEVVKLVQKKVLKPVIIQLFGITEVSQSNKVLCEIKMCKKSLFKNKKNKGDCIRKQETLDRYLEKACLPEIMRQKQAYGTDILGAIDKSKRIATAQGMDGDQTLIILSDFTEFRKIGMPAPEVNLKEYHILLVYRSHEQKEGTAERILPEEEVKKYSKILKAAKAENVFFVAEEADFVANAAGKLH